MSWKLILPILGFMIDVIAASEKRVTRVEEPILASPAPTALRRQAYSNICGYENANVLSQFTCNEGSACFAEPSYNVAGYCCRIGNFASCTGPTQCIAEASLSASCNGDCSSNERITKW
ncbi:hypothetical protein K431DRAFT_133088 [Polychaeton citri CBS 116435]|uniref:Uncharacterized protein n=1 Tax=Polychaeton citri CBS 116435 TaxID=1314669 RepID=A0A9P4QCN4_9PEZI|nr:hypothetical protein K431DRAFT_133088 [Polychaeton citri CBS 116435]